MKILKAEIRDLPQLAVIYDHARRLMRESGNPTQWKEGHPAPELLLEDIARGQLYKVLEEDHLVGGFAFTEGPEEAYATLEGTWLNEEPYRVIHRIGAYGAKGVLREVIAWAMTQTDSLRIDTHEANAIMRRLLEREGFTYVGRVTLPDGDHRRAYHKVNPKGGI